MHEQPISTIKRRKRGNGRGSGWRAEYSITLPCLDQDVYVTPRQLQALRCRTQYALSNTETAARLKVTPKTVSCWIEDLTAQLITEEDNTRKLPALGYALGVYDSLT